ncbi:MAG: efflux RND transporter permease subunit, partial [Tepidisphaeraceae bacterium]
RIFREFAITIIVSIFASGLVSLTLTPMMCSRMLARRGKAERKTLMERLGNAVLDRVLEVYGSSLTWFLKHRWVSLCIWIFTMFGTLWLFGAVPKSFLPIGDSGFVQGLMIGQEGASYKQMRVFQNQADAIMHANPAVQTTFTLTGFSQYLPSNQGFIFAFLKPRNQRPPISAVAGQLMGAFRSILNAFVVVQPSPVLQVSTGATANAQGKYAYAMSGIDADQVDAAAQQLAGAMFARPDIFASVSTDLFTKTPSLQIDIRRDAAATYGISATTILQTIRQAYSQNYVYLIKRPEDQFQVILEARDSDRTSPSDLATLYVRSDDGQRLVPLPAVASWHETLGPQNVNHINQFSSVTIYFNLKEGVPVGVATDYIAAVAAKVVPPGIRGNLQGEAKDFADTVAVLKILMLLAVFVMYVILGILYESYVHPLTVLSALPVALSGGLATLWIAGKFSPTIDCSLYAFIGLFMLMGIVKKNGIMMIDFALQRMAQGQASVDAIHDASMNRFRPIIMTTLAALMGAVPIALGYGADGQSRRPLGLVIVGGLIVSQFITLYITPVIYLYLEQFQEKVLDRTSFFHSVRIHSGDDLAVMGHEVGGGGNGNGNGDGPNDAKSPHRPDPTEASVP